MKKRLIPVLILGAVFILYRYYLYKDILLLLATVLSAASIYIFLASTDKSNKKVIGNNMSLIGLSILLLLPAFVFTNSYLLLVLFVLVPTFVVTIYCLYLKNKRSKLLFAVLLTFLLLYPAFLMLSNPVKSELVTITSNESILGDIGIINNINELRGEDGGIMGRLLHNKTFYLKVYVENIISFFNPAFWASMILLVNFWPLVSGFLQYSKKRFFNRKLLLAWIVGGLLPVGFFSLEYSRHYFLFFIPLVTLFIAVGAKKINSRILWLLVIINFLFESILFINL